MRATITIEMDVDQTETCEDAVRIITDVLVYMADNVKVTHIIDEEYDATA